MRATKEQAFRMIMVGDIEEQLPAKRNDKRRICIFCEKQIPKGETYYTHFEYPYMKDQERYFCCKQCLTNIDKYLKFAKLSGEEPNAEGFIDWLEENKGDR